MTTLIPVLEVGGTHVTSALVATEGGYQVQRQSRRPLDAADGASGLLDALAASAWELGSHHERTWAVAIPGPFDYPRGIARYRSVAKFDALSGLDVGAALRQRLGDRCRSISFLNDAEAFTVGEWVSGAAQGRDRVVGLTLGTGMGSAFLSEGCTVDSSPEVPPDGHVYRIEYQGRPIEDSCSRRALLAAYGGPPELDVREIAANARAGDERALLVFDEAFLALGTALAPWLASFHPDCLVIGGSIGGAWDLIEPPLTRGFSRSEPPAPSEMLITTGRLGEDAALIGAAHRAVTAERNSASVG